MRPLKLTLEGEYWDVQVYAGHLFLFTADGSLQIIDWDRLVNDQSRGLQFDDTFTFAFARNDIPRRLISGSFPRYQRRIDLDPSQWRSLSRRPRAVLFDDLARRTLIEIDPPAPFPHAESHFYMSDLFVAGRSGVYRVNDLAHVVSEGEVVEPHRLWDAPTHHLSTSLAAVAFAAGEEGLWQAPANMDRQHSWMAPGGLSQVSAEHCTRCSWLYFSLFGSSHVSGGYLARFHAWSVQNERHQREVGDVLQPDELGVAGYSWANSNRICSTEEGEVQIFRYREQANQNAFTLTHFDSWELSNDPGSPLRADVAPFGLILEFENLFMVLTNGGHAIELPPEPVRWRCYPRAKYYFDQLHVVYEDELAIYSFSEDAFEPRESPVGSKLPAIWTGRGTYDQYKAKVAQD